MKPIINLNFLTTDMIICDNHNHYFIVTHKRTQSDDYTCRLVLIDIYNNFSIVDVIMPIACDENYDFVSSSDKSVYKFYETNLSKNKLKSELVGLIKKLEEIKKN